MFSPKQLFSKWVWSGWILSSDLWMSCFERLLCRHNTPINPQVNQRLSLKLSLHIFASKWMTDVTNMLAYLLAFRTKTWWFLPKKAIDMRAIFDKSLTLTTESLIQQTALQNYHGLQFAMRGMTAMADGFWPVFGSSFPASVSLY